MKWIVEDFINKGENTNRIRKALEYFKIEYLLVKIDKENTLKVLDKELYIEVENSEIILENFIKNKDVIVYGSKKLVEISNSIGISPGSFSNINFNLDIVANKLNDEFFNADYKLNKLNDIFIDENELIFIRPIENNKLLNGRVYNKTELDNLKQVINLNDIVLFTSSYKKLFEEYRFFIVNNEIISFSSYKDSTQNLNIDLTISEDLIEYVKNIILKFNIANAYVLDVGKTNKGYKVIEYNNINTSGLYNCNEYKIVDSLQHINI